jgi:hypothetical protein
MKDIQVKNSICYQQPPNDLIIPFLKIKINKWKHNENVFTNTSSL